MTCLDFLLDIIPSALEDLKSQCARDGVEDFPQVEYLLNDPNLSNGLHRDWRKAVFRILDSIFASFEVSAVHAHDRLHVRLFPFFSLYSSILLSRIMGGTVNNLADDTGLTQDRARTLLTASQRKMSGCESWNHAQMMARWSSSYKCITDICEGIALLLTGLHRKQWTMFAECLLIVEHFDMCRKVYQSLDQDDIWTEIVRLRSNERGKILDLWQSIIDSHVGECGKLKRMMFKVAQETCTLPASMIMLRVELESRDAVHGGGCADIYRGFLNQCAIALKVLRIFNEADMKAVLPELCKEAIVWRQLKHNNVAPFLGFCKDLFPDRIALVSPWMTNGDLSSYLKRNPEANRLPFAMQIASGMDYLHSQDPQIIHGDLRANNVLVDSRHVALITDFGISKANVVQTNLSVQSNRGAARWQAPELHYGEGLGHVTTMSDVYAYGMTCYEIFTDTVPFAQHNDVVFILELFVKKTKLTRPINSEVRGLTTQLWCLFEECWDFEPKLRPTMRDVLLLIADEESLKERERIRMFPTTHERELAINHSQDTLRELLLSMRYYDLTGRVRYDDRQPERHGHHSTTFIGYYTEEFTSSIASETKLAVRKVHGVPGFNVDIDFSTRLSKELRIRSMLNHPHILPLIGYTLQADGYPCLISEWMENGTASRYLKQCSDYDVLSVALAVAEGLRYLHGLGIIHGDIKGDNILISPSGHPLICGFEDSFIHDDYQRQDTDLDCGDFRGSLRWMATELVKRDQRRTFESDVWAFGMTVYELFSGHAPYNTISDTEVAHLIQMRELPHSGTLLGSDSIFYRKIWNLCSTCWEANPTKRYTMRAIVPELKRLFKLASEVRETSQGQRDPFFGMSLRGRREQAASFEST